MGRKIISFRYRNYEGDKALPQIQVRAYEDEKPYVEYEFEGFKPYYKNALPYPTGKLFYLDYIYSKDPKGYP